MDPVETFLEDIRRDLAEAGKDLLSDETIVQQLKRAELVLAPWAVSNDDLMQHCIAALGSYFSYLAYTSLAEKQLGSIPETSTIRIKELKHAAYLLIVQIAPVNEDLIFDPDATSSGSEYSGSCFAVGLRDSVLGD